MRKDKIMFRFEGKLCPVCREAFREGDDIAVCPECGTPHHRACYGLANKCAFDSLHTEGYVWNGRLPDEPEPAHTPPEPDPEVAADYADIDREEGIELTPGEFIQYVKMMTEPIDDVTMQELLHYTARSFIHYRLAFAAFRGQGTKKRIVNFNICSGLFAPVFQFYRKMDVFGVIVLALMMLPVLFLSLAERNMLLDEAALEVLYTAFNFLNIAMTVLLCVFGDYIYYRHAVKRILKIRKEYKGAETSEEYIRALEESGTPSFGRAALGFLALMFAQACVMAVAAGSPI